MFGGVSLVDLEVLCAVFSNQTMVWEFERESLKEMFMLLLHGLLYCCYFYCYFCY